MKSLLLKDRTRRFFFFFFEKKMLILKYIVQNLKFDFAIRQYAFWEMQKFYKKHSVTKIRNRCLLSNRARASYKKFKISRIFFKKNALKGQIMGVRKASW